MNAEAADLDSVLTAAHIGQLGLSRSAQWLNNGQLRRVWPQSVP
jgi:hypothetical protein